MSINSIPGASALGGIPSVPGTGGGAGGAGGAGAAPNAAPSEEQGKGFSAMLGEMVLHRPSRTHADADALAANFAAGGNVDPHQMAIATAKAGVEIQMATRTISQAVSAVRTLFQMQV